MESLHKKNNWPKKIIVFVMVCVLLSAIIKGGSRYYFDNYWTPGMEKQMLNKCILDSKIYAGEDITNETITNYCKCNLEKIKAKYKPKEISTIYQSEFEAMANECNELIK